MAAFPGEPTRSLLTINTADGPRDIQMYTFTDKQTSFSVTVSDLPSEQVENTGAAAILDGARDGAVANTQGDLFSDLVIEVAGHPGRELKIAAGGGKATIRVRLFIVKNRLYQDLVVTPVRESYAPRVRRFLESVELL